MRSKKNEDVERGIKAFVKQNAFQIFGLLVLVLNLVIAFKLAPIEQTLAVIVQRVDALEKNESACASKETTNTMFREIRDRLNSIDDKIDKHIQGF